MCTLIKHGNHVEATEKTHPHPTACSKRSMASMASSSIVLLSSLGIEWLINPITGNIYDGYRNPMKPSGYVNTLPH